MDLNKETTIVDINTDPIQQEIITDINKVVILDINKETTTVDTNRGITVGINKETTTMDTKDTNKGIIIVMAHIKIKQGALSGATLPCAELLSFTQRQYTKRHFQLLQL